MAQSGAVGSLRVWRVLLNPPLSQGVAQCLTPRGSVLTEQTFINY